MPFAPVPLADVPISTAARLAEVTEEVVERWIANGELRCERLGKKRYVPLEKALELAAQEGPR